jgi:hypothetical protein
LTVKDWEILSVQGNAEVHPSSEKTNYLIIINETYLPFKVKVPDNFALHSFTGFEHIGINWKGDEINHFTTWAVTEEGYFIYDDLLRIQPGCWQGGFVPRSMPCYDVNMRSAGEKTPIVVYKRK